MVRSGLLMLPLLGMLVACQPTDTAPAPASDTEANRLLRGAMTAIAAQESPTLDALQQHVALTVPLEVYRQRYPDPLQAHYGWLLWWSARHQDAEITPAMHDAASVVPLLLPELPPDEFEASLLEHAPLLFAYDPPLHQPDADLFAVTLARHPGLFKPLYATGEDLDGSIRPVVVEQAMSRLLLATRDPSETSLTLGLRLAGREFTTKERQLLEGAWAQGTLRILRSELDLATPDLPPQARLLGQPHATLGRESLLTLYRAIPAGDAIAFHPALLETMKMILNTWLTLGPQTETISHDMAAWYDEVLRLYAGRTTSNPSFEATLNRYLETSPRNWREGT